MEQALSNEQLEQFRKNTLGHAFVYVTSEGFEVPVRELRHHKIQNGYSMHWLGKGLLDTTSKWTMYEAAPRVAAAEPDMIVLPKLAPTHRIRAPREITAPTVETPKAVVVEAAALPVGATKAQQIRAKIVEYKATGQDSQEPIINWAMEALGMNRTLARTYVKNNWDKK
jgi:hypothetical protein